jgi:hypothetical protein
LPPSATYSSLLLIGLSSYSAESQPYYHDATRPTLLCSNLITTQTYVSQHRTFEEEVYHLITRLSSRSEIHSPTPAATTRNKWATREDLLTALHSTFHIRIELYSNPSTNQFIHTLTTPSTQKIRSFHPAAATHHTLGTAQTSPTRNTTMNACAALWNMQSLAPTTQPHTPPAPPSSSSPVRNTHHTAIPNTSTHHTPTTITPFPTTQTPFNTHAHPPPHLSVHARWSTYSSLPTPSHSPRCPHTQP